MKPPIQSAVPDPGLSPLELARDVLSRIEQANKYARQRKHRFRWRASAVRLSALAMSVTSTIILGLQPLNLWTGLAFSLVALTTVVNTVEPFFAWRSRWVLMEETQYRFYRLRDELTFYLASRPEDQVEVTMVAEIFRQYQEIWDQLGSRWIEYRRTADPSA